MIPHGGYQTVYANFSACPGAKEGYLKAFKLVPLGADRGTISIDAITFDIEVFDTSINDMDAEMCGFEIVGISENNNTIIRFNTNKLNNTDEDENSNDTIIPFQVAYAISIHKAQGLEYKSVNIVITHEVEEHITHNIFYTAITRAKEHLTIYWTPETESKILNSLKPKFNKKDWGIIKSRYPGL